MEGLLVDRPATLTAVRSALKRDYSAASSSALAALLRSYSAQAVGYYMTRYSVTAPFPSARHAGSRRTLRWSAGKRARRSQVPFCDGRGERG